MGKLRFVQPDVTRLDLSEGDWIEVKKRLTVGEEREAFQAVVGEVNTEGWRRPNLKMMGIAELAAYIVDWSFDDAAGKRTKPSAAAIGGLSPEDFKEVEDAVTAHIAAIASEDEARKNGQGGESKSEAISPSVVG